MATAKKYKGGITHAEYAKQYRHKNKERSMISYAKDRANKKGLEFNIEHADIIIPSMCPVLEIPIFCKRLGTVKGPCINSPSLDRIDNSKGYVKGNIQVISHLANTMKASATREQLIKFARWILKMYGEN